MALQLPLDFREFLRLLNETGVEYLLIGGYAVGYYGYPRYTGDIAVWVRKTRDNAERLVTALKEFGFDLPGVTPDLFMHEDQITRMGREPVRIEIMTTISGVDFDTCFAARHTVTSDGIEIPLIALDHLLLNKRTSARHKDLEDALHLERARKRSQKQC